MRIVSRVRRMGIWSAGSVPALQKFHTLAVMSCGTAPLPVTIRIGPRGTSTNALKIL